MAYIVRNVDVLDLRPSTGVGISLPFDGATGINTTYTTTFRVTIILNNWYHIDFVKDYSKIDLYLNLVKIDSSTSETHPYNIISHTKPAYLGSKLGISDYLSGGIDEFSIYLGNPSAYNIAKTLESFNINTHNKSFTLIVIC